MVDEDSPSLRPILHKGSQGEEVGIVRHLLGVPAGNRFDDMTEAAVRAFQIGVGLAPSGVVDVERGAPLAPEHFLNALRRGFSFALPRRCSGFILVMNNAIISGASIKF